MTTYFVKHTDITKQPKIVEEGSINDSSLDITLFGRIRLEYGEKLNQNLLNMLENFSIGQSPDGVPPPTPSVTPSNIAQASSNLIHFSWTDGTELTHNQREELSSTGPVSSTLSDIGNLPFNATLYNMQKISATEFIAFTGPTEYVVIDVVANAVTSSGIIEGIDGGYPETIGGVGVKMSMQYAYDNATNKLIYYSSDGVQGVRGTYAYDFVADTTTLIAPALEDIINVLQDGLGIDPPPYVHTLQSPLAPGFVYQVFNMFESGFGGGAIGLSIAKVNVVTGETIFVQLGGATEQDFSDRDTRAVTGTDGKIYYISIFNQSTSALGILDPATDTITEILINSSDFWIMPVPTTDFVFLIDVTSDTIEQVQVSQNFSDTKPIPSSQARGRRRPQYDVDANKVAFFNADTLTPLAISAIDVDTFTYEPNYLDVDQLPPSFLGDIFIFNADVGLTPTQLPTQTPTPTPTTGI